jgi:4-oxalocrotonate tautomerase family enzyme
MPNVYVEGPPLGLEQKREMSMAMTDIAAKAYGTSVQAIVVVVRENPPENVCVAGRMVCDERATLKE